MCTFYIMLEVYTATLTPKPAYGRAIGLGEYQHHLRLPHKAFRQKILMTYVLLADIFCGCICCFVSASDTIYTREIVSRCGCDRMGALWVHLVRVT